MLVIQDKGDRNLTISEIKQDINKHKGKNATIKCNLGRNKYEKYNVTIKESYNNIFLVELNNQNNEIKSFSYADVFTKTIKIDY